MKWVDVDWNSEHLIEAARESVPGLWLNVLVLAAIGCRCRGSLPRVMDVTVGACRPATEDDLARFALEKVTEE